MNSSDRRPKASELDEQILATLLGEVRRHFYAGQPAAAFHRHRRRLLYALTWPAAWLDRRGLFCSPERYRRIVGERLDAITAHGDHTRSEHYLPRYLLKCLQDHLRHRGDELDRELKHVRNALDLVRGSLRFADKSLVQSRQIEAMAKVHRLLHAQGPAPSDPAQMALL